LAKQAVQTSSDIEAWPGPPWADTLAWYVLKPRVVGSAGALGPRQRAALGTTLAGPLWTQSKALAAGAASDGLCRGCLAAAGTLAHRRWHCPVWDQFREQALPAELAEAAAKSSDQVQEALARAWVAPPRRWLPPALLRNACPVKWFNKPASGVMSGNLFTDGSAINVKVPGASRAGWAVVAVGSEGEVESAAYGPVPWDLAPSRGLEMEKTSRSTW